MLQLGLIDKDNRSFAEDVARGRQENYRDAYILYLAYIFPEVVTRRTFKREMTDSGGIIEAIPDTVSLDSLKKKDTNYTGLAGFFERRWGVMGDKVLKAAQKNFVRSLVNL